MSVTEHDRAEARALWGHCMDHEGERGAVELIARALADERDRARAPFLAYAAACADIGNDRKAGVLKRAVNRSVAQAFRRAAEIDAMTAESDESGGCNCDCGDAAGCSLTCQKCRRS